MPVRSSTSSILRWPDPGSVRRAAEAWARDLLSSDDHVERVGYFGSYARGDAGVGSDLDLVVVVDRCEAPFCRRGALYDAASLPVPADILVYTVDELDTMLSRGDRFSRELAEHTVWFSR